MFSIFRDADQLANVEEQLETMLASCEDAYRLATTAAFGEADVVVNGTQLKALDKEINRMERSIRRELLIHGNRARCRSRPGPHAHVHVARQGC